MAARRKYSGLGGIVCALGLCAAAHSQNFSLDRGEKELRVFGGFNRDELTRRASQPFGPHEVERPLSAGADVAFGLNRIVAVTGDYAYDRLGTLSGVCLFGGTNCGPTVASRRLNEFMGGVRFTVPTDSRLGPYGAFTLGGVNSSSTSRANGSVTGRASSTNFAIAAGGGLNVALKRHFGVAVDGRAVIPINPNVNLGTDLRAPRTPGWMFRLTIGIYFRL